MIGIGVYAQAESEHFENEYDSDASGNKGSEFTIKSKGDSGAFSLIYEHLKEVGASVTDSF